MADIEPKAWDAGADIYDAKDDAEHLARLRAQWEAS